MSKEEEVKEDVTEEVITQESVMEGILNYEEPEEDVSEDEVEVQASDEDDQAPQTDDHGDTEEDIELAMKEGWAPFEKWKGKPEDFKPAHEFNKVGKNIVTNLKEKNSYLEEKLDALNKRQEKMLDGITKMTKSHESDKRLAIQQALEQAEMERKEAILEGDLERVSDIETHQDDLRAQVPEETVEPEEPPEMPNYDKWAAENPWYEDKKWAAITDSVGDQIYNTGHFKRDDPDFYEAVTIKMKHDYPELFEDSQSNSPKVNPKREKAQTVARSSKSKPKSESKATFASLSHQEQQDYKFWSEQIPGFMSKEEWAAQVSEEDQ